MIRILPCRHPRGRRSITAVDHIRWENCTETLVSYVCGSCQKLVQVTVRGSFRGDDIALAWGIPREEKAGA